MRPKAEPEEIALIVGVPCRSEMHEVMRGFQDMLSPMLERYELQSTTRRALAALNQSILAKAFRGELVPQDPNDEPASVLLDRIRAERAAAITSTSTKPRRPRSTS